MGVVTKLRQNNKDNLIASTAYAICETAAATATKVATIQGNHEFHLIPGVTIHVKFTYSNTASNPTLNVNSTGAIPIMRYGTTAVTTSVQGSWADGAIITLTYDGASWVLNDKNETYVGTSGYAHAEGYSTTASANNSHAEGYNTTASGYASHAEGGCTIASGNNSHAEGGYIPLGDTNVIYTTASGASSHAEGFGTIANHKSQHVFGEYNVADTNAEEYTEKGDYIEIVGNGTADDARSNARTLDWSGNEALSGTIEATDFGTTLQGKVDDRADDRIDANVAVLEATPGAICSFNDAAPGVNLKSLIVEINATQSGSGDPSPNNIRPIIGVSECNVVNGSSINIWDEQWEQGGYDNNGEKTTVSVIRNKNLIPVRPNTTYYFYRGFASGIVRRVFWDENMNCIYSQTGLSVNTTFTTPNNAVWFGFNTDTNYGTTYRNDISINNPPSETGYNAHTGGAYTGNTYTIALGDTYYGGSLDVTNGVLTVTWKSVDMDSLNYVKGNRNTDNTGYIYRTQITDMAKSNDDAICEIYAFQTSGTFVWESIHQYMYGINGNAVIFVDDYANANDFKAAVNGKLFVYPLATPFTIQLTPTQIEQLLGTNNVFADCGDITECIYYKNSQAIQTIDTLSKQNSGVRSVTVNDKYLQVDTYGVKTDLVVPYSDTTGGVIRATMESTSTATAFVLTAPNITSLYDGLTIVAKNTVIASASGCTISLNGLDAKGIWLSQSNSACTSHWAKNVTYIFIYDATNERWELQQGRDTDSTDIQTIRMYYTYFTAGTHGLMNRGLLAKLRDSDTYSSFTITSGKGNKTYNTTDSFDLSKIYFFSGTTDIAAGATSGANTINLSYSLADLRYTLNGVTTSATTSVLEAKKPLYLLFDKDCKLCSPYFTQDIYNLDFDDAGDWGVEYAVLLGIVYDSYRMDLLMVNPIYRVYYREWYIDPTYGDTHLIPTFKPDYCSSIEENKLVWTNSNPHASATITGTTTTVTSEYLPLYSKIRIDFFPVFAMYAATPFYVDIPKNVNDSQAVIAFFNYAAKNGLRQLTITKLSDTSFEIEWSDGGRYDTYGTNTPTVADTWGIPYKIYLCN